MASSRDKIKLALVAWLPLLISAMSQTIHPHCQDKCGDITIPYPFGTTEDCSLNSNFFVACITSYSPPKPFLWDWTSNVELLEVSLDGYLRVNSFVAYDCYNEEGMLVDAKKAFVALQAFPFSVTRNKFIGIGCDTLAVIHAKDGKNYSTGCLSLCSSLEISSNGSCFGIGCCQTSIPKNLLAYEAYVISSNNHTDRVNNSCSYSLLVEEDSFNFSDVDFINLQKRISDVPSVLDWSVGNQTCEEAMQNLTSYACQANSLCHGSENGPGHLCRCLEGYVGNPYLPCGCQDLDECAHPSLNDCSKTCINIAGGYTCSCPKGYRGDGRKGGEGCAPYRQQGLVENEIVIGTGIGLVILLIGSGWLYHVIRKRKIVRLTERYFEQNGGLMLQRQLSKREGSAAETAKIFTARELKKATEDFHESRIIGRGGYGTVYKGILPDNQVMAIKKSKLIDRNQIELFINELFVLSQINHRNVVKLLGCCLETEVPLLVYEFVNNGTLFDHIHKEKTSPATPTTLSWETRLRIATETAGVLSYLHSAAAMPIIHRDFKSTNILLDDKFTAKVSDFGASKLVPHDQSQLITLAQGTFGYLDPEYLQTSQLTEKSDVYSFGVVLAELLTGRKALCFDGPEAERNLAMYFLSALEKDCLFQILEDSVRKEGNREQLREVADIAEWCLRLRGEERPTMKKVFVELDSLRMMTKSNATEYLIGESSSRLDYAESHYTCAENDTMYNNVMLPICDGR